MSGGVVDRANAGESTYGNAMSELEECMNDSRGIAMKALEQRDALAVALRKYGRHQTNCLASISFRTKCSCGLDAALAVTP